MSCRDTAERVLAQRDKRDSRDDSPPNGPIVSIVPGVIGEAAATARLREWHRHLTAADDFASPAQWTLNDWLTLVDDARWLYENHASYAVRNGWTAHDLFGVRPGMPHLGGLADFLESSRSLKLCDGKAYWTQLGVKREIGVGCGDGCVLLWDLR